jgi:uncharacterized protein (DUF934 family)
MMALIKDGQLAQDSFVNCANAAEVPNAGPIIVSVEQWQDQRAALTKRNDPVGVLLLSDQHPEIIAGDLQHLSVVALDFPTFRDGRAYSYARLLRDRYQYAGEIRAVGDVLLEQLHYMERVGINAFEFESDDPAADFKIAAADFSVWYQSSADRRIPAASRRHLKDDS